MKRAILLLTALVAFCSTAGAQIASYKWTPVPIDSTWDNIKDFTATEIIGKYSDLVEPLDEILCYSADEYNKRRPESELSDFAADAIKAVAEKATGRSVDLAMTNFGGIRTSMPKGAVRVYDIYSIFPFNNTIVVVDMKGSDIKKLLGRMSTGWVEALSNVEIFVDGNQIKKFNIAGAPVDDEKIYRFATVDFLLDGGDSLTIRDLASSITQTGVYIRDGIVDLLREKGARGEVLDLHTDGRVQMINQPERRKK